MTFAPDRTAAGIALATVTVITTVLGQASPSRADANLPRNDGFEQETILFPVPDCPKCLVVFQGGRSDSRDSPGHF